MAPETGDAVLSITDYSNIDLYSSMIYRSMGIRVETFPVLFAVGRTPGRLARWGEGISDPEQKVSRPPHVYVGRAEQHLDGAVPTARP